VSAGRTFDVAVVGAGIVGLAATDALLRRGARVVCLAGGQPGHGQSAGDARGFRHLHADPALTALAVRSAAAWRRLEERAGVEILERGGALHLRPDPEAGAAALADAGVSARVVDGTEARRHLPWLAGGAGPFLFDPGGGAVRARPAFSAFTRLAGDALVRARVEGLDPAADGVRLATSAGDVRCERCLVCAGTGTERLVAPVGIALDRTRRVALRLTFPVRSHAPGPVPVWGDRSERFGERAYGTPEGPDRYAVGLQDVSPPIDDGFAEAVPAGADVTLVRGRLIAYVRAAFPGLEPHPVDGVLRLTTALRGHGDDAFGLWERDGVLAFAGHNLFKHAAALGELLAGAALGEEADPVLRPKPRPGSPAPRSSSAPARTAGRGRR
jgi:sarcosine oxidase